MTVEKKKCARRGCDNDGYLSFRGRADLEFCQGCYQYMAKKIHRIDVQMQKLRTIRNLQAERDMLERSDNEPARIGPEQ